MSEPTGELLPIQQALMDIGEALEYPVDRHGNHYDFRYLIPVLAWHLARAGFGKIEGQAVIKRRVLPNEMVEWVDIDAPDELPDPLANMTLADLANATPAEREAAARRLQGAPEPPEDLDAVIPWTVRTNIQVDEEELSL